MWLGKTVWRAQSPAASPVATVSFFSGQMRPDLSQGSVSRCVVVDDVDGLWRNGQNEWPVIRE